ncbi:hypothetical protein GON26_03110 [Flavobacterium sp. GA093]|uniref:Uncharacterized protein n=1 Tax=Flavobacterium hydrocarbonoxydans TaxID=2683249 RepID=A0A6I4NQ51_9FLAO|nr:hypothetical protein [Flavobacterium hydrocarbonoxydans]MWB93334.1 hypothetical protein [Flavobacterium hydrocarbonoxydans]
MRILFNQILIRYTMLNPFAKSFIIMLVSTQSHFAQKYNPKLVAKDVELNFADTPLRGIENIETIYYVENDLQTVSAYQNNILQWQTNVILVCGKPTVGKPEIRYIKYEKTTLLIVSGKHSYAEIDIINGKTTCKGSD